MVSEDNLVHSILLAVYRLQPSASGRGTPSVSRTLNNVPQHDDYRVVNGLSTPCVSRGGRCLYFPFSSSCSTLDAGSHDEASCTTLISAYPPIK